MSLKLAQSPTYTSIRMPLGGNSPIPKLLHDFRCVAVAWLLCWAAILVAGLWPFTPYRHNGVRWLQAENGIGFDGRGVAYTAEPFADLIHAPSPHRWAFTVELLLRPRRVDVAQVERILSVARPDGSAGLLLAQYKQGLVVRAFYAGAENVSFHEFGVLAFAPERAVHVSITAAEDGTEVYVDGHRAGGYSSPLAIREFTGGLVLGNSGASSSAWVGDLLGCAVYDRKRTAEELLAHATAWRSRRPDGTDTVALYDFQEKSGEVAHSGGVGGAPLLVPRNMVVLQHRLLVWDLQHNRSGIEDLAVNVAGFVPFGFLGAGLMARRISARRSVLVTVAVGLALSLLIEAAQSYIPLRSSSSTDLLMNTVGTAIGAALFALARNKPQRDKV